MVILIILVIKMVILVLENQRKQQQDQLKGASSFFTGEHSDSRTYKVSFKRIFEELGDWFKPEWDLDKGANELVSNFNRINFDEDMFRGILTNRLLKLKDLKTKNKLADDLRWI